MSIRRLAPLALLVLLIVAVAAAIFLALDRTKREAKPADSIAWAVNPPTDAPRGDAFRVVRAPSLPVVRWKGVFAYEQTTSGRLGTESSIPDRVVSGPFTATEATSGPAASESTAVDAILELEETIQSARPAKRSVHARLTFSRGADGAVVHRSIRVEAPADAQSDLEVLQFAWTQRFAVPDRPVRVGERLPIDECLELDDAFRRPLWFLFKERAAKEGPISEPVEGGAWIESKGDADGGEVRLRAALTHAHTGVNGPEGPNAVVIDYRAVLDGDRTIRLEGGDVRRHAMSLARRIHYTSRDLDYAVVVRARVRMESDATSR